MNTSTQNYFILPYLESFKNETKKPIEMQLSYVNAMGWRSNIFRNIEPGETITRTNAANIICIFKN